jgi:hypothetical protein
LAAAQLSAKNELNKINVIDGLARNTLVQKTQARRIAAPYPGVADLDKKRGSRSINPPRTPRKMLAIGKLNAPHSIQSTTFI